MSKYRRGVAYLRHMKPTDKANDFRTAIRMATFADKSCWKNPEEVKPVVLVQHGVKGVAAAFMNKDEALRSLMVFAPRRVRNPHHSRRRGLRHTQSDLRRVWRGWRFKETRGGERGKA